ncbi:MAG: HAD-IIIA family hydrolase [Alphaproteobacteria bacterium]|nr:HAD-IIIA family hydrolase [Alphaproteobacteria bacterium]
MTVLLILDRDGVLNAESPERYVRRPAQWRWLPGSLVALGVFQEAGWRLAVATNQSGVGRGLMTGAALDAVHARMSAEAAARGVHFAAIRACPHAPWAGCTCRKPRPGLLLGLLDLLGERPEAALLIGDAIRDLTAARAAGVRAALVRTGKGATCEPEARQQGLATAGVFDDLLAASRALAVARRGAPGFG